MKKYEEIFTFEHLYKSYILARKSKRNKIECIDFEINLMENLNNLYNELNKHTYQTGIYKQFYVYEPKERLIMALPFRDRIVQHCLCDYFLEPILEKCLIYDNFACRHNKGTHKAIDRTKCFMQKFYRKNKCEGYVLKCDISKFFYNINYNILKNQLKKYITDYYIYNLVCEIIDSTDGDVGLPIGNQTSQWFAIFYMSGLDHFIKEKLRIKFYNRYMDDFILIHKDKEYLKYCKREIQNYVENKLELKLNNKTQIFPLKNGIDYLGFHMYLTNTGKVIMKVRKDSKERVKKKLKKFKKLYKDGMITKNQIDASYNSWIGHAKHGNSYHLIKNINKLYEQIFEDGE